ncbi:hypothetical protein J3F84DRAFT_47177 [Trichoderma pleuroticola]
MFLFFFSIFYLLVAGEVKETRTQVYNASPITAEPPGPRIQLPLDARSRTVDSLSYSNRPAIQPLAALETQRMRRKEGWQKTERGLTRGPPNASRYRECQ